MNRQDIADKTQSYVKQDYLEEFQQCVPSCAWYDEAVGSGGSTTDMGICSVDNKAIYGSEGEDVGSFVVAE